MSPEMALRLSKVLGRTPESWLAMQDAYDLWQAKQHLNLANVHPVNFASAWTKPSACTKSPNVASQTSN